MRLEQEADTMERIWDRRELPVLRSVVEATIGGRAIKDLGALAERTGLNVDECSRAVTLLVKDDYIDAFDVTGMGASYDEWMEMWARPKAMRATMEWPGESAVDELLHALDVRINSETDAHKRGKLQQVRDGLVDIGKGTVSELLAAVIRSQL